MDNKETLARYLESLALVMEVITGKEELGSVVYSDIMELMAELGGILRMALDAEEGKS